MQDLPEKLFRVSVINYNCVIFIYEGARDANNKAMTSPGSSIGKEWEVFMLNANDQVGRGKDD